ncbi:MAG TPA: ABC-type transport auxiliary lipoprotein family protein [Xanthobacteraceae bacterium]|jgi:uncharacterized lipoprotein YmbA
MNLARVTIVLLVAATGGCRSVPAHYYSLTSRPQALSGHSGAPQATVKVMSIPASADRLQLVVHQGNEISILENHQWIAPLSNEIETALSIELLRRLHDDSGDSVARSDGDWSIRVNVLQLEAYPGDRVFIAATWIAQLGAPPSAKAIACRLEISEPIRPGVDATVDGYRALISKVADQIAMSISANTGGPGVVACLAT